MSTALISAKMSQMPNPNTTLACGEMLASRAGSLYQMTCTTSQGR